MNSEMPRMPSLPTMAISADAPSSMTYSSETMDVVGKVDVPQPGPRARRARRRAHRNQFQVRREPLVVAGRQRVEQVILARRLECARVQSFLLASGRFPAVLRGGLSAAMTGV